MTSVDSYLAAAAIAATIFVLGILTAEGPVLMVTLYLAFVVSVVVWKFSEEWIVGRRR